MNELEAHLLTRSSFLTAPSQATSYALALAFSGDAQLFATRPREVVNSIWLKAGVSLDHTPPCRPGT
ncbi:hypothetical protein C8Q80DRAFT_1209767 [Daedaleopsis nitida]|nr:hypothetical protein C8Q80DRAFT_1209767 [Daedaleopsis nitida]